MKDLLLSVEGEKAGGKGNLRMGGRVNAQLLGSVGRCFKLLGIERRLINILTRHPGTIRKLGTERERVWEKLGRRWAIERGANRQKAIEGQKIETDECARMATIF